MPGLSQLPATPSPGSSSTSTNSGSGSGKSIRKQPEFDVSARPRTMNQTLSFTCAGTDTVKRGISPAASLSTSMSNTKLKESESNYSIKNSSSYSTTNENHKSTFPYERATKTSNGPKSVIFASDVGIAPSLSSSSSYSLSDQLKINSNVGLNPSTTSTSQLIKQTLSPLTQHRNMQPKPSSPNTSSAVELTNSNSSPLKIHSNHTSALAAYQFSPSSLNTTNTSSSKPPPHHHHHHQSSLNDNNATTATAATTSSIHKSSPSRILGLGSNHTSTLPSSIARNMYQSESSYPLKNQPPNNFASPGNGIGVGVSANATQANSIYGTLPKSSGPFSGNGGANSIGSTTTAIYGNVSAVANEFEQIIARNSSSAGAASAHSNSIGAGNYNTLGSYRVQYSSTNPFLPSFNPHSTEMNAANHDDK